MKLNVYHLISVILITCLIYNIFNIKENMSSDEALNSAKKRRAGSKDAALDEGSEYDPFGSSKPDLGEPSEETYAAGYKAGKREGRKMGERNMDDDELEQRDFTADDIDCKFDKRNPQNINCYLKDEYEYNDDYYYEEEYEKDDYIQCKIDPSDNKTINCYAGRRMPLRPKELSKFSTIDGQRGIHHKSAKDFYMMKTKIIPPVCPKCPDCTLIQHSSNAVKEKVKEVANNITNSSNNQNNNQNNNQGLNNQNLNTQNNVLNNISSVNMNNNQKYQDGRVFSDNNLNNRPMFEATSNNPMPRLNSFANF